MIRPVHAVWLRPRWVQFFTQKANSSAPEGVTVVNSVKVAQAAVRQLKRVPSSVAHAVDVETSGANIREDSPWAKGELLCFSIYCGEQQDFGSGPKLFVDTQVPGVLQAFAEYFADPYLPKVFHNYSYDRGLLCRALRHAAPSKNDFLQGFHADTMHMARLIPNGGVGPQRYRRFGLAELSQKYLPPELVKIPFKEKFREFPKRSDGTDSKRSVIPTTTQLSATKWHEWVQYATQDTVVTWNLFVKLKGMLLDTYWETAGVPSSHNCSTMWDFYQQWYRPLGQMLSEVEELGIRMDTQLLETQLGRSEEDILAKEKVFRDWVWDRYLVTKDIGEEVAKQSRISCMNLGSDVQKRQLLFAPRTLRNKAEDAMGEPLVLPEKAIFPSLVRDEEEDWMLQREIEERINALQAEVDALKAAVEKKVPKGKQKRSNVTDEEKKSAIVEVKKKDEQLLRWRRQLVAISNPSKPRDVIIHGLQLPLPSISTTKGLPSTSTEALMELCGKPPSHLGKLKTFFSTKEEGEKACQAVYALTQVTAIKKAQEAFLRPLLKKSKEGRIHPDLNLNTDTGRLSCRRPNFQNLPAGSRDEYFVRKAVIGEPGHCIVTADYSQLELRVLAHLANCKTLIDAFASNGDIHSETAYDLHPHIAEAYGNNRALAMVDLKKRFGTERNKAKTLNFGILYGQSALTLAKDWGTSKEEAEKLRQRWFDARPEVQQWQENLVREARKTSVVYTLMGRPREILYLSDTSMRKKGHAERTVTNTPVQGSAADIVMAAMLDLHSHPELRKLGYRVIMQVHDEVLMEGPAEWAEEAMAIMALVMAKPEGLPELKVPLVAEPKMWTEK
eukprot:GGOE01062257.1.p1 GENE.GGOE01062257.1~~GGOE01062257.1.p1  ORF type:complete len:841 (+),score=262.16 GGOE01062257.1:76-2598(+)